MDMKKKKNVKDKTVWGRVIDMSGFVMIVLFTLWGAVSWGNLPSRVALHYNIKGEIDRWGSKNELLIIFIIVWIFYLCLGLVEKIPVEDWSTGVKVTEENRERVYRVLRYMIKLIRLTGSFAFCMSIGISAGLIRLPVPVNVNVFVILIPVVLIVCIVWLCIAAKNRRP